MFVQEVDMEETNRQTAQRVRALRAGVGMTQEQYAAALGVTRAAVRYWETTGVAHRRPNLRLLELATDALRHVHSEAAGEARASAQQWGWSGP